MRRELDYKSGDVPCCVAGYETVALPLSYTGDARCANESFNYGAGEGAASGKFDSHQFFRERGRGSVLWTGSCREFWLLGGQFVF